MTQRRTVVAYRGDLASSYLVWRLSQEGGTVIAVSVDAGEGIDADLGERARRLGADSHHAVDARRHLFDAYLVPLIQVGGCLGGRDPLWSAAAAYVWADHLAAVAREQSATTVAYSAARPGDAVRLELALAALVPQRELIAPVRDDALTPAELIAALDGARLLGAVLDQGTTGGLTTRGGGLWTAASGGELDDAWSAPDPDDVFPDGPAPNEAAELAEELLLGFRAGVPVSVSGKELDGVSLVEQLEVFGRRHALGQALVIGEDPLGIKRREAIQAAAAAILIAGHAALERLVLSDLQLLHKQHAALTYADLFTRGLFHEPVMRDLKALISSSQRRVEGEVRVRVYKGGVTVTGARSAFSRVGATAEAELYDGRDVEGFARVAAIPLRGQAH